MLKLFQHPRLLPVRSYSPRLAVRLASHHASSATEEELQAARQWLRDLNADTIPRNICNVTFSRSSGPGGQNVNKVNSKATLTVPLDHLTPILPHLLRLELRRSRYYKSAADALVIQSDDSRKQADNIKAGFEKLYRMIEELGRAIVPGETSEGQKQRVKDLAKADDERRLRQKKMASSKKSARKGGKGGASDY